MFIGSRNEEEYRSDIVESREETRRAEERRDETTMWRGEGEEA